MYSIFYSNITKKKKSPLSVIKPTTSGRDPVNKIPAKNFITLSQNGPIRELVTWLVGWVNSSVKANSTMEFCSQDWIQDYKALALLLFFPFICWLGLIICLSSLSALREIPDWRAWWGDDEGRTEGSLQSLRQGSSGEFFSQALVCDSDVNCSIVRISCSLFFNSESILIDSWLSPIGNSVS